MDANACGLEFESFCGVVGEGCGNFSCSVCEWDMFVYEGDEATTTPACSVESESCVIRKLGRVVFYVIEFSFLNQCYVYVVIV